MRVQKKKPKHLHIEFIVTSHNSVITVRCIYQSSNVLLVVFFLSIEKKVPTKYLGRKERSFIGKVGASLANLMSNCHTKVTEYQ